MTITLGADPEIFFVDKLDNFVSAIDKIGGSKEEPKSLGNGFFILEDNVAAEFNIPPADMFEAFDHNVETGIDFVAKFAIENDLLLTPKASGNFPSSQLEHYKALEFGCEPDFDAWELDINDKPEAEDSSFRTCGGHIHVGGVEGLDPHAIIRAMDLFLGVPSLVLDKDKERRKLYGKAGAFRYKPYGVEYRTLSNFWIWNTATRYWVWNATNLAIEFVKNNGLIDANSQLASKIRQSINYSDESGYYELVKLYPDISVERLLT